MTSGGCGFLDPDLDDGWQIGILVFSAAAILISRTGLLATTKPGRSGDEAEPRAVCVVKKGEAPACQKRHQLIPLGETNGIGPRRAWE